MKRIKKITAYVLAATACIAAAATFILAVAEYTAASATAAMAALVLGAASAAASGTPVRPLLDDMDKE